MTKLSLTVLFLTQGKSLLKNDRKLKHMNGQILTELQNNAVPVLFDLSYNLKELYPSCYPQNISHLRQQYFARHAKPLRFCYGTIDLTQYHQAEASYFMYVYCTILKNDIHTVEQLEAFFTWMSTIVMDGFLEDTTSTMELWDEVKSLRYRKPNVTFTPTIRSAHEDLFYDYLFKVGNDVRRLTIRKFIVIPG